MAAIALFPSTEQTLCTVVVCDSKWVAVSLHSTFLNIQRSGYGAVWPLHSWCHGKLLPSQRDALCTPRNHAPVYSVSACSVYSTQPCTTLQCQHTLCVLHATMHQFTVSVHALCTPHNHAPLYSVSTRSVYSTQPCTSLQCQSMLCVLHITMHQFSVSTRSAYSTQPCTSLQCQFIQSHTHGDKRVKK